MTPRIITAQKGPKLIHMSLKKSKNRNKIVCNICSICHSLQGTSKHMIYNNLVSW